MITNVKQIQSSVFAADESPLYLRQYFRSNEYQEQYKDIVYMAKFYNNTPITSHFFLIKGVELHTVSFIIRVARIYGTPFSCCNLLC